VLWPIAAHASIRIEGFNGCSVACQGALNGVMLGLSYALGALGLSLIFGIMRIVNFATASMFMLGWIRRLYLFRDIRASIIS